MTFNRTIKELKRKWKKRKKWKLMPFNRTIKELKRAKKKDTI